MFSEVISSAALSAAASAVSRTVSVAVSAVACVSAAFSPEAACRLSARMLPTSLHMPAALETIPFAASSVFWAAAVNSPRFAFSET